MQLTGRNVLAMFGVGFGAVLSVNLMMVWFALESWPGLVSNTAYQDGLNFNRVLESGERQDELGWKISVEAPSGVVELVVTRADGTPVKGLSMAGTAYRPAAEGNDSPLSLREVAPGVYRASDALPLDGNWTIFVDATLGEEPYHIERRIFVTP
jgi:nitrogen fixation protein FixH